MPNVVPMMMFGRRKIFTDFDGITRSNLKEAIGRAGGVHAQNVREIEYLFRYYRGDQPILYRTKTVRPDITYNTVINHALEIVAFKTSYFLGDPIVYISRKAGEDLTEKINQLNDWMYLAGKDSADKELADDFHICGTSYRLVYPKRDWQQGEGAPFTIETLDPHRTFVAYQNSPAKNSDPVFGATYSDRIVDGQTKRVYDVYTKDRHYIMVGDDIREEVNPIGEVPIIEYVHNEFRIGAFEAVMGLLDGANALESNRIEATGQNVQALTWFNDVELPEEAIQQLKSQPSAFVFTKTLPNANNPNIKNIIIDMQQADQQVLQNDLYKTMLSIAGMPSTGDGNTADSSNNGSTIVRNGWQHAEARAKDTAMLWDRSDRRFIKCALRICRDMAGFDLSPEDVVGKFTRRNYEDIMTKSTVLTTLLGSDKVDPKIAYQVSDIAPDPEAAYLAGMAWFEQEQERQQEQFEMQQAVQAQNRQNTARQEGGGAD